MKTLHQDKYPILGSFTVLVIEDADACGAVIKEMPEISAFSDTIHGAISELGAVLQLVAESSEDVLMLISQEQPGTPEAG